MHGIVRASSSQSNWLTLHSLSCLFNATNQLEIGLKLCVSCEGCVGGFFFFSFFFFFVGLILLLLHNL